MKTVTKITVCDAKDCNKKKGEYSEWYCVKIKSRKPGRVFGQSTPNMRKQREVAHACCLAHLKEVFSVYAGAIKI